MARDSLFGEEILWSGRPRVLRTPPIARVVSIVAAVASVITLGYAIVVAKALAIPVGGMIAFAAWCAAIGVGAWRIPIWWQSQLEYIVTDKHVIWRRGRLRRTIDKGAISYALIRWDPRTPSVGDLVLVRAVPTGALRRTLSLTLNGVTAPDRLWAIVRGVVPSAPLGDGERPLAQRLDDGERVLWSAIPMSSTWTVRRAATAALGACVAGAFVQSLVKAIPGIAKVLRAHTLSPGLVAVFVGAAALGLLLLLAVAVGVAYASVIRPLRLKRATRYFVTDARVLIRRGSEELHLDRSRIAYVIDAPLRKSTRNVGGALHDVFLVLDGPQARAMAMSGAFGEQDADVLRPVFTAIADADTVNELLRESAAMKRAA
jgi:hypothetical protein